MRSPPVGVESYVGLVTAATVQLNPVAAEEPPRPTGSPAGQGAPVEEALPKEYLPHHEAAPAVVGISWVLILSFSNMGIPKMG